MIMEQLRIIFSHFFTKAVGNKIGNILSSLAYTGNSEYLT